jgi:flagellar basal-body rod modification protein FlgD
MSTSAVNPTSSNSQANSAAASAASTATLANQNVFLQLLVAQLKYQDPDNPASGTEFVTQLAQFADLSNTTDMASDLDAIKAALTSASASTQGASGTTGTQTGTSQTQNQNNTQTGQTASS